MSDLNLSGSLYNWDMKQSVPYESNTLNASGSAYNWIFDILSQHDLNLYLASGSNSPYKM